MDDGMSMEASIIRNARILSPRDRGVGTVVTVNGRIAHIGAGDVSIPDFFAPIREYDVQGDYLVPGLIDGHVHILGGGGEGGPATRTPEISLSHLTTAGITTVVGLLGTDSTTRSIPALLAKARALEKEGLTARIYTGAYRVPGPTLTGSVRDDIALLDSVIGAKVALSDHRASHPPIDQLRFLASECRVGGMLGAKPGLLHVHVGNLQSGLDPLFDVVENTGIPASQLYPTHVARSEELLQRAAEFTRTGGYVDVTAGSRAADAVRYLSDGGAVMSTVTLSSDGNGSMPKFDADGNFVGLGVGSPTTLLQTVRDLVRSGWELPQALPLLTTNPAAVLGLDRKGSAAPGMDADLLCLSSDDLTVRHLWARGELMVRDGEVMRPGTFEK